MYTYKLGISAQEHDDFVKHHPQANLLQSANWAKIKDNWGNERVGFYQDGKLVASASILIRPLPLGMSMFYIPRGPVMDYTDQALLTFVFDNLKKIAKQKRALFIKFDPFLLLKQYKIGQKAEENLDTLKTLEQLLSLNIKWSGRTMEIADSIQPRFQANVYTASHLEELFPKHTRRLMKDARTRGVTTRRGTLSDVNAFSQVVALTETRKGVALRNHDYFHKMMSIYGEDAYLHLATVHLTQRLKEYKNQLAQIQTDLEQTAPNQKKRLTKLTQQKTSIQKYIQEFEQFVVKYPQEELVVAGILSIRFGSTMEMLYAGMNDDFKKFYPQYSLYPKVFEDAFQDGISWSNMGGVEGSLDDGLTKFKSNFNPMIEEYVGEFNLPTSFLYHLSNYAYTLRKKLRSKKH